MAAEVTYPIYDSHIVLTDPGISSGGSYYLVNNSAETEQCYMFAAWNETATGYATITFTGTRIKLWGYMQPTAGMVDIVVDGGAPTTVDLYSATYDEAQTWDSGILTDTTHTITYTWKNAKNASSSGYYVTLGSIVVTPSALANPIADGNFGVLTGRLTSSGEYSAPYYEYEAIARFSKLIGSDADPRNYIEFSITTANVPSNATNIFLRLVVNGVEIVSDVDGWLESSLVTVTEYLGQCYLRVTSSECGNWRLFTLETSPDQSAWDEWLSFPVYAFAGTGRWSNPYGTGTGYVWSDTAAAAAATPALPEASWYTKNHEVANVGGYGAVIMLENDGTDGSTYTNLDDDSLVSISLTEYFDPTTATTPVNSCIFKIHVPYDRATPQATIDAFMAQFAVDRPFRVERGWYDETTDTIICGFFFVTSAKLNKESWTIEVEGHDSFGLLADQSYWRSSDSKVDGFNLAATTTDILSMAAERNLLTDHDYFVDVDTSLADLKPRAPFAKNISAKDLLAQVTNYSGARWYVSNTGRKALVATQNVAPLAYKIDSLMVFGVPVEEDYEKTIEPHTVAIYNYAKETSISDICTIPKFSGYDEIGTLSWITVDHDAAYGAKLYERSGGVDTEISEVLYDCYTYCTRIRSDVWIKTTEPLVIRPELVIKGYELTENASNTASGSAGSSVDNNLITVQYEANCALAYSFPDFSGKAYRFSMRDDPSLRLGNVVQLAVDNLYRNVLLVEAKRTFDGSGRVEFLAAYLSDTAEAEFITEVTSPTVTYADIDGYLQFDWTNLTGYDDWSNVSITYIVYDTTSGANIPIGYASYPAITKQVAYATDGTKTFSVGTRINGVYYPLIPCVWFGRQANAYRHAGAMVAGSTLNLF